MTLIELLVSIAIFTIITSVVLFNHTEFNSNVLVTNLAYEVALAIRQAQTYGLSVKQGSTHSFGIYVDTNGPQSLIIFEDTNNDGIFNGTGNFDEVCPSVSSGDADGDTCEERLSLRGNVEFSEFCVYKEINGLRCSVGSDNINWSSVMFKRPNPIALIYGEQFGPNTDNLDLNKDTQKYFTITLKSNSTDKHKTVKVERTGQISVVQE